MLSYPACRSSFPTTPVPQATSNISNYKQFIKVSLSTVCDQTSTSEDRPNFINCCANVSISTSIIALLGRSQHKCFCLDLCSLLILTMESSMPFFCLFLYLSLKSFEGDFYITYTLQTYSNSCPACKFFFFSGMTKYILADRDSFLLKIGRAPIPLSHS